MTEKKVTFHVVGSGMGGACTAISLVELGFNVVLLDIDAPAQEADHDFESVGLELRHKSTLSYGLGGGSNLWHGVTAPLDVIDFNSGVGITKYIKYDEMMHYWKKASKFLGYNNEELLSSDIKSESIQSMARQFPYDNSYFEPKLYKVLRKPARLKAKLTLLESRGLIKILRNTEVKCINVDTANKIVKSITVNYVGDKFCSEIEVQNIVLCAGAINTVKILLNSRNFNEGGLYNPKSLIGRGYFDHPMGFLGKIIFDKPLSAKMYSDLAVNKNEKLRLGLIPKDVKTYGNTNIYLRPSTSVSNPPESDRFLLSLIKIRGLKDLRLNLIWLLLKNPNVLIRALLNKYSLNIKYRAADIFFVSEQTYNFDSRISLGENKDEFGFLNSRLDWRISEYDYSRISNLFNLVNASFSKIAGARLIDHPTLARWKEVHTSAAHHLGGITVGDSLEDSIVDQNLCYHELNNLWICDGSVFPAVGNSNPSLTIIALSLRLTNHLKKKFR